MLTFLCILCGQQTSYGQIDENGGELGEVIIGPPDPEPCFDCGCDPFFCGPDNSCYDCSCDPSFCDPNQNDPCYSNPSLCVPEDPYPSTDPSDDNPCSEAVDDKLEKLTQAKFAAITDKFNNPNSLYKVNISVGSLGGDTDLARTMNSGTHGTYNIVLNENYSNATSLSIATSLVHEYIHAYFNTVFDDWANNGNSHAYDNYPFLHEAYVNGNGDKQEAHHNQIAASFIDIMAAAIQEFQTGIAVPEGQAEIFYKDMAWGSMQGTSAYESNTYLSQTDRDRIGSERAAETYNEQRGANEPKGAPCDK
ncbi:hypothetical protein [Flavobacterium sp.]|uniref:hypothetical protein n=1 Tax=Flavobacterium sp. TaxID=239 RepID=UPI003D142727